MTFPAVDLYPGPDLFPGTPLPLDVGGYRQPIEVAVSGLILTATDSEGVDWVGDTLTGWFGSTASSMQPSQKTRGPGSWAGPRQLTSRPLTLAGMVEAPDSDTLQDALDRLNTAASLDACILTVSFGTSTRSAIVYRQGEVTVSLLGDTTAVWSMQLQALDPRKFASTLTDGTALPSVTGGLIAPLMAPLFVDSVVVTGSCYLTSPGNYPGPVQLRIDGPCSGPVVTHVGSGLQLVFGSSLVIAAGDWLEVDMEAQTALANGQASRNPWITSRGWSSFSPGQNQWAFTAATYDPTARLTVAATPAWM